MSNIFTKIFLVGLLFLLVLAPFSGLAPLLLILLLIGMMGILLSPSPASIDSEDRSQHSPD